MHFLAEVKVGSHRVLEQVHAEVADENEEECVRHLRALGQHAHERGREHETCAAGDKISQRRQALLMHGRHEERAGEIGGCRSSHEGKIC